MIKDFDKMLYEVSLKLKNSKLRLGFAESFTGGELASSIVSIEGASDYFLEGIVCYSPLSKIFRLGVSEKSIKNYTVVSSEVALEMVNGLLQRDYIDLAVATTGYAGVSSDFSNNGIGYLAIGDRKKSYWVKKIYEGDRNTVRKRAVYNCLEMIYEWIK